MNYLIPILLFVFIILFNSYSKKKETFQNNDKKWSPDLIRRFLEYQTTVNNNVNQFNMEVLQEQASSEEAEDYLKNGYWTWSDELQNLYREAIWSNTMIKIDPQIALNYAMTIYNQNAATQLLAWNTKEGHFLLYGANNVKCSNDRNSVLMKNDKMIKPEEIPAEVPGFHFIRSPCNPCSVFNTPRDFSCPFQIRVSKDDKSVSLPWKIIWGLQ